jgi:serine/threonine protein kinase
MAKTYSTSDLLRSPRAGDTAPEVFESAAAESLPHGGTDEHGTGTLTPLHTRLREARGRPVRLGRYDVLRRIGVGGMGVVYEAIDVEQGQRVALKTLRVLTGPNLHRFKQEFRSLAPVAHPNLLTVHELSVEDGEWFFSMEHVRGVSFFDHALVPLGHGARPYLGATVHLDEPGSPLEAPPPPRGPHGGRPPAPFHEERLRSALRGLTTGVAALHGYGLVHRDVNASNVLVTAEGRAVLIDFGLVTGEVRRGPSGGPFDRLSGTPSHMSPEQAAGKAVSAASDWYALGVTLFEALTGQLPFQGAAMRLLRDKQAGEAPAPSSLVTGVPRDLEALCAGLLRRRPEERPDAVEVLRRVGGAAPRPARAPLPDEARREELGILHAARRAARRGRSVVLVEGPAGIGKTALCARFAEVAAAHGALALRAAVSAREAIPCRLLDGVVDALALHLADLDAGEIAQLLPDGARALAAIFPVLEGVPGVAEARAPEPFDVMNRVGLGALGEILGRLSRRREVVIWIDGLEHAAASEVEQLAALSGPPAAPAPLLLLSGEPLPAGIEALLGAASVRRLRLAPPPQPAARAQAREALRRAGGEPERAEAVATAAGACPRLVEELAGWAAAGGDPTEVAAMLADRAAHAPAGAERLLEVLGAARGPIPLAMARRVAKLGDGVDATSLVVHLAAAHLVRARGLGGDDLLTVYDEHARAAALHRLSPEVKAQLHRDLARALARWPGADPEEIAEQLHLGGDALAAATQTVAIAERAVTEGDFDRAASLFGRAVTWAPRLPGVAVRHAEALAAAGRAAEAARAFLGAARGRTVGPEVLDLRRRAGEHLLLAGRIEEGLAILRPVLLAVGLRPPGPPSAALVPLGARLIRLAAGSAFPQRSSPARAAAAWSLGRGLVAIDPVGAMLFVVEALLAARAVGDEALAAKAATLLRSSLASQEPAFTRWLGPDPPPPRDPRDDHMIGLRVCARAWTAQAHGRFLEALAHLDDATAHLDDAGVTAPWERHGQRTLRSVTLLELGRLRERAALAEGWLAEARAKGDRVGELDASLALALRVVAADDPVRGRADARAVVVRLGTPGFTTPAHLLALILEVGSLLYEGDAAAAWTRLEEARPSIDASQILWLRTCRVDFRLLCAITGAAARRSGFVDELTSAVAALVREGNPHALASADLARSVLLWAHGDRLATASSLIVAAHSYDRADMKLHAACARRTAGALLGGEGAALVASADAVLRDEGVVDPARFARMYTGIST